MEDASHTDTGVVREWIPRVIRQNLTPGKVLGVLLSLSVAVNTYVIRAQYQIGELKSNVEAIKESVSGIKTDTNSALEAIRKQLEVLPEIDKRTTLTASQVNDIRDWKKGIDREAQIPIPGVSTKHRTRSK